MLRCNISNMPILVKAGEKPVAPFRGSL